MMTRNEMIRQAYLKRTLPELHRNGLTAATVYKPRAQTGKGASFIGKQNTIKKDS